MIKNTFVESNLEIYHIDKKLPCHKMWLLNGYVYIIPYEYSIFNRLQNNDKQICTKKFSEKRPETQRKVISSPIKLTDVYIV